MSGEESAFAALTLLLAVCEQTLTQLAGLEPPLTDGRLATAVEETRDRLYELLTENGRFGNGAG
jgi:hypothetical protein